MIDVDSEDLFPLSRGADNLKSRPASSTFWRWALRGVRGRKLETVLIGGRRYSSREALDRFIRSLNEAQGVTHTPCSDARVKQKASAARRAEATF
jgi:hypothetical protein